MDYQVIDTKQTKYIPKRFSSELSSLDYTEDLTLRSSLKQRDYLSGFTLGVVHHAHRLDDLWTFSPLTFEILGKNFSLNHRLKNLYHEIQESKRFLSYKDDWDDEDAIGCNAEVYLRSIDLLIVYAEYVLKFHDIVFKVPEISLLRDGSIDIEWRSTNRMLLINVVNSQQYEVHFYGKDKNTTVLKGFLYNNEINRDLSHWMHGL